MTHVSKPRRDRPPLDKAALNELALRYVSRFATSRAKLRAYLGRKVRERGWAEPSSPDLEGIANRFAEQGYVDDAAFAMSKSISLGSRGYGRRRLDQTLRAAGIDDEDAQAARNRADESAVEAALRFAARRRIGPFATADQDQGSRERALAAMVRAGHHFGIARAVVNLPRGASIDEAELRAELRISDG